MRVLGLALALIAVAGQGGGPALVRLAEEVAKDVERASAGRPVELLPAEDRTASPARALDFHSLVAARLAGRVTLRDRGPRLRVRLVLGEAAGRLVVTGRVTEEPGGGLVDLVSASVEADPAVLSLVEGSGASGPFDVSGTARTALARATVVDLEFLGEDHLVVLEPLAVSVWRRDGLALRLESRADLPSGAPATRFPGGAIAAGSDGGALWVLTSLTGSASLVALEPGGLRLAGTAEALPFAAAPAGLRFRPGTNLIEARLGTSTEGPFLAVEPAGDNWVVDPTGRLGRVAAAGVLWSDVRVGPALAPLGPGLLAAASADPPGATDHILVLDVRAGAVAVAGRLAVPGPVRALASRTRATGALLAAATGDGEGGVRLVLHELVRRP